MDRRLFGLGLLLLIIGIVLAYASVQSIFSSIPNYISATQNIAVQPKSDFFVPIAIGNESILQIVYNSSLPVNFYLMNSTARNSLPKINATLIGNATYLQGNGLIYEIRNSTHGIFPYLANISLSQKPAYWNNQTLVASGTYYIVFQNYENKTNTVFYTILNRSVSSLASSEESYSYGNIAMNISSTLAVIAGIILMFYGLFMKPKKVEEEEKKEVERLYSAMNRKHAPKHRMKRRPKTVIKPRRSRG